MNLYRSFVAISLSSNHRIPTRKYLWSKSWMHQSKLLLGSWIPSLPKRWICPHLPTIPERFTPEMWTSWINVYSGVSLAQPSTAQDSPRSRALKCAVRSRRPFRLQTKYGRCHMCMCPMRPTLVWRGPSEGLVMMPCKTSKQKIHQSYPVWVPLLLRCFVSKGQGFGKGGDNNTSVSGFKFVSKNSEQVPHTICIYLLPKTC